MAQSCMQVAARVDDDSAGTPHLAENNPPPSRAPDVHADLQAVITAWPTLSEAVRATILQLIQREEVRV